MTSRTNHQMKLTSEAEGTQQWECPDCGRVMLIEWQPWRRVVVVRGDEHAAHSGATGGLEMGFIEVTP